MGELLRLRNDIANEYGISAHRVATNRLLETLTTVRPSDIENLTRINDFAQEKAETIGVRFIEKIKTFSMQNNLKLNNFDDYSQTITVLNETSSDKNKNFEYQIATKIDNDLLAQLTLSKQSVYQSFQIDKKSIVSTTFKFLFYSNHCC